MTNNEGLDPRNLTFSQAQGYEQLPGPLALGQLSDEARVKLWDLLVDSAWYQHSSVTYAWDWDMRRDWKSIFQTLHSNFLTKPRDEFTGDDEDVVKAYRTLVLEDLSLNKLFDLFQMFMRHPNCPNSFTLAVAATFKECGLAYVVDTEKPATILPTTTKQEGEAIIGALKELREAGLQPAEAHLRKAAELINGSDWPGAVRESIHAVESVARQLDPKASTTLGPALASLEKGGHLHPALKEAFSRLYGYTSDEEGIRHALIDNAESPAGQDEAVFMLGACASFASYLWRKYRAGSQS